MTPELIIATCQFPVSGDIKKNAAYILRQMAEAKEKGADISHFPESSLSGYAGTDFKRYKRQDEDLRLGSNNHCHGGNLLPEDQPESTSSRKNHTGQSGRLSCYTGLRSRW